MPLCTTKLSESKLTYGTPIGLVKDNFYVTKLAFVRGDLYYPLLDFIREPLPHCITTVKSSKTFFTHISDYVSNLAHKHLNCTAIRLTSDSMLI